MNVGPILSKSVKSVALILFCFSTFLALSQNENTLFIDRQAKTLLEDTYILGYSKANSTFYILMNTAYWQLKIESGQNWIKNDYKQNDLVGQTEIKNLEWVSGDQAVYLVSEGSGSLYQFNGQSIIRLKNSEDQRSHAASTYYIYNHHIINYSGYGFWQYPSFLSSYNVSTESMAAVSTKEGTLIPPSQLKALSLYNPEENALYVWGGAKTTDSQLVPSTINNTNELWQLKMETGIWKPFGKIKLPKPFGSTLNSDPYFTFAAKDKLYCILGSECYEFDIASDKISTYTIPNELDFVLDSQTKPAYSEASNLVLLSLIPFPNQNIRRIQFVSLNDYKSSLLLETNLFKTPLSSLIQYIVPFALLILLALLSFLFYKYYYSSRNKLIFKPSKKTIKYNNKKITILDKEEEELLFWFAQNEDFVTTNHIMDRLTNGSQSYESMKKRKLSTMNSIELKLEALLRVKQDIFIWQKSKEDLRLKECKLNPALIIVRD